MSMNIQFFDPALVDDNPWQPRTSYSEQSLRDLATDMLTPKEGRPEVRGMMQIPQGRMVGDRVQLAFGHRRKRAFVVAFPGE